MDSKKQGAYHKAIVESSPALWEHLTPMGFYSSQSMREERLL
jgi:hypothetical protein